MARPRTGGSVFHLTGDMFDPQYPLYLRGLSLFHFALPPTIVWLLWRWDYDSHAEMFQAAFTVGCCRFVTWRRRRR
jgi:hypothetical protein